MTTNGGPDGPAVATVLDTTEVVEALLATSRVLVALTARSIAALDADLTLPQYRLLVTLTAGGARRTTDLAAEFGVTPSTVTRTCDRLVRRGLAQRFQRAADRRVSWVALTEEGKDLIGEVVRQRRAEVVRLARAGRLPSSGKVAEALTAFVAAAGELPEAEWWRRWEVSAKVDGQARL